MLIDPTRNGPAIRSPSGHKIGRALQMALARRCPPSGLLHHSDRGSPSTSQSYLALLQQNGRVTSMSRTANCYDNAVTESFFS